MFLVTLGTPASASTWIFNVARKLMATRCTDARSFYAEDGLTALKCLGAGVDGLVLKAHCIDPALMTLVARIGGKVIVSSRDPRDVLVSMQERFGYDHAETARTLSKSLACIASLPDAIPALHLRYEDGFHMQAQTIRQIADFLGYTTCDDEVTAIFDALRPEAVRAHIDALPPERLEGGDTDRWDFTTHWHPGHVGDGLDGKWVARLPSLWQDLAAAALMPLDPGGSWRTEGVVWPAPMFQPVAGDGAATAIALSGGGNTLRWGPYMHLPIGRWRIRPALRNHGATRLTIRLEVCTVHDERGVIEQRTVTLPSTYGDEPFMDFDVLSYFEPIELRLLCPQQGGRGVIDFSGASLHYLGPCDQDVRSMADPIED